MEGVLEVFGEGFWKGKVIDRRLKERGREEREGEERKAWKGTTENERGRGRSDGRESGRGR